MRIKIVAAADERVLRRLREYPHAVPKGSSTFKETLLFHPQGAYGVPELIAIRVWGERDEAALAVHLGHDLRNQEEQILERGEKDRLLYKYMQLGFQPLGEFDVHVEDYRVKEFRLRVTTIKGVGSFVTIERTFPGEDTDFFAREQRRALQILRDIGVSPKAILDVDVRGLLVTLLLQQLQQAAQGKQ